MQDVQRMLTPLAAGQTITSTGGTTDKYDGSTHLGKGEPLGVEIIVTAIDAASTDETYTAQLRHDGDSAFGSPTAIGPVLTILRTITAPKTFVLPIPANEVGEQYWDVLFTLGGTTPSITVKCEVKPLREVQQDAAHADAITIL